MMEKQLNREWNIPITGLDISLRTAILTLITFAIAVNTILLQG